MREHPKILVVDDEEAIQSFVAAVLSRAGYEPKEASTGSEALDLAETAQPDAVILDLRLPDKSGLEVCSELRRWYRGPILVLSGLGDEATIVAALDRGADDYLTKPFRSEEFLARLRALMRRAAHDDVQETVIGVGALRIDLRTREVQVNGEDVHLTRTEFDILAHLASNRDRVVTSESLLRAVWGPHHGEYAQTLRVHVGHIRKKIERNPSEPEYVLTALGVGYRFYQPD
ncbi:MAG: response regulator transcription factor [Bryobacterales bacterium]